MRSDISRLLHFNKYFRLSDGILWILHTALITTAGLLRLRMRAKTDVNLKKDKNGNWYIDLFKSGAYAHKPV